ncbi:MAG TPA: flagellar motor protein MotD [Zoogloea sp.]|uniref:flagellar motor protein MotD n=1 Tax=Zoogloea sp. TaxID=49181 RepID=UPI002C764AF8|nr:flagellar motor protein MotD [Zoogloea sp.]HOB45059.1 flagellar motor protein MotD [Zoogloea sp.]HQA10554.1 flagellar motor protein MotD [Zoogloea sp.]HQE39648.1 flagellar motor protein MotD [Zoogloea sp.]
MARRRKRSEDEHENHERWLVSYADFITLLFAFFVVMYSLSSINEGKYRIMSDSVVNAFRNIGVQSANPRMSASPIPSIRPTPPAPSEADEARKARAERVKNMAEEIRKVLAPLVADGQVRVTEGAFGITVEINASVLFAPGEAQLGADAVRALRAVGQVVADAEFPITVEGHTDVTPIATPMFPSNWELSAVRASSVVRLFVDSGVRPARLTAAGYGDQRPVADNATSEGRARNRRVTILIESRVAEPVVTVPPRASGVTDSILPPDAAPPPPPKAEEAQKP